MKKICLILLMLLPMCVFGQSRESNKLYNKGIKLYEAEKYKEAIPYFQKSDSLNKAQLNPTHIYYYSSELAMAECYEELALQAEDEGRYNEALKIETNAMEIYKKALGEKDPYYATSLSNIASFNADLGNYTEAIRFGNMALEICKKAQGEKHRDYGTLLSNLADYYSGLGNDTEAIRLGNKALGIMGEGHPNYAKTLSNLGLYNYHIGNYNEAIRLGLMARIILKILVGEEHLDYATSLNNLAMYNAAFGNHREAIRLETMVLEIQKKVSGEERPNYASTLNNLASYNAAIGNYSEAIRLGTMAMEIRKKVLGEEHPDYAMSLNNLAIKYAAIGNHTEAIRLGTMALGIQKKVLGEEHPDYAISLNTLAKSHLKNGNYDTAIDYFKQWYQCQNSFILKTFSSMTTKERNNFWGKNSYIFTETLPCTAYEISSVKTPVSTQNEINVLAYNSLVFSKGLLLNAELEIQKLIEQSNDPVFANLYLKIKQDRAILDKLYNIATDKRTMNADSLSKVIDNEERQLVQSSKELGDYTKNLSITWQDIQKSLKDNDVAIEFSNITDTTKQKDTTNQTVYIALILKKGMSAPELVKLDFSEADTVEYTTPILYNHIWQPLDKYLKGAQNVYFSPAGMFHNIGIEYLPDESGEIFAKKYSAYRLSSTRELALNHVANPNKKATVYGGIVYNFDEADWQNVADEDEVAERGGGALTFLKGSKKEAAEIFTILSNGNFDVKQDTGKVATEESFKKLSGSGIKLLHIATHGFYEPENKENSFAKMLSVGDKNSKEDLSLNRSGLFFAGANTALDSVQRQFIPEGVDDGILTAKDISRLDFKGLDLVVLSACQTGLGEVTSEGVFGLQRGFKKAGAQTIIMSLWNVSDKPTKELMTEFYRNLVAGKTKREAFISAQDKIRLKYFDPKMWAGFIMVDGY